MFNDDDDDTFMTDEQYEAKRREDEQGQREDYADYMHDARREEPEAHP